MIVIQLSEFHFVIDEILVFSNFDFDGRKI